MWPAGIRYLAQITSSKGYSTKAAKSAGRIATPIAGSLSEAEKNEVLKTEIRKVTSKRPARENIHSFVTLPGPLSPDDGTLTRTMKPRRQVILSKYKAELDRLYLLLK